jgi:hypothetical protein
VLVHTSILNTIRLMNCLGPICTLIPRPYRAPHVAQQARYRRPVSPKKSTSESPRTRVQRECRRRGEQEVAAGCIALLKGQLVDPELIVALGGPPAAWVKTGDAGGPAYWFRVWGARGLLYAWDDKASDTVIAALDDEAWRVREMACKVVAHHRVRKATEKIRQLEEDSRPRVREAAARALMRLTGPADG